LGFDVVGYSCYSARRYKKKKAYLHANMMHAACRYKSVDASPWFDAHEHHLLHFFYFFFVVISGSIDGLVRILMLLLQCKFLLVWALYSAA
jgi:hypothetical protein